MEQLLLTGKEYDYAIKKGKIVIPMVQGNPSVIEVDDTKKIKFAQFHKKVMDHGLANIWDTHEELTAKFIASLENAIKKYPLQGWIRCNSEICKERLEFVDINTKISSLKIKSVKTIHIMASGTYSYIPIVKNILKKNKSKNILVNIFVYFRLGNDAHRIESFRNQYDYFWTSLKKEYPKIKFHFSCINDFKMSFRGVIINGEIGLIGFYTRVNGATYGTLEDSIFVNRSTNVGKYILKYCLKCFDGQKEYPTLKSCVDNSI